MLFTYNQAFRFDRHSTARRDEQVAHLAQLLDQFNIEDSRIVYIGYETSERRTYVAESPFLLRLFFARYEIEEGCVALTDNGKSFWEGEMDVLLDLGFAKHTCYPAAVHQFLSPNEDRYHGAAKRVW